MEEQIPASQPPQQPLQQPQGITPEQLEAMKVYAREQAVRMSFQQAPFRPDIPQMQRAPEPAYDFNAPKVIYVARNFTIAELLVIGLLSCTVAFGLLKAWDFGSKYLPQIEVRVK
jgi:hypothetical protein